MESSDNKTAKQAANGALRNQIILMSIIVVIISTAVYLWMFLGSGDNPANVAVMMWSPAIAAGITGLILKTKLSPYGWKTGRLGFWGLAYLLPVVVAFIGYGLMWLFGVTDFYTDEVVNYKWAGILGFNLPAPFVVGILSKLLLASLLTFIFALGEEIGWSAFLVPRLVKAFSVPVTSVISGLFWAIWHYPALISGLYGHGAPLWAALPGFTLVITGASFIKTVLIVRSHSFWPGVILHTSHNVVLMGIFYEMTVKTETSAYYVSESGMFLGLVYLISGIVFWYLQKDKLKEITDSLLLSG